MKKGIYLVLLGLLLGGLGTMLLKPSSKETSFVSPVHPQEVVEKVTASPATPNELKAEPTVEETKKAVTKEINKITTFSEPVIHQTETVQEPDVEPPILVMLSAQSKAELLASHQEWREFHQALVSTHNSSYNYLRGNCQTYVDEVGRIKTAYDTTDLRDFEGIASSRTNHYASVADILSIQARICANPLNTQEDYTQMSVDWQTYGVLIQANGDTLGRYRAEIDLR